MREGAHSLKGSSANIGAPRCAALAGEIEEFARHGHLAEAASRFGPLGDACRQTADALKTEAEARTAPQPSESAP